MADFERMVRLECTENDNHYFSHVESGPPPTAGQVVKGFPSFQEFLRKENGQDVTVKRLLAPIPYAAEPIYCVGVNFKLHAQEAKLPIPNFPMIWIKPAAALAGPDEDIPVNKWCADTWPDYEGEFTFVTGDKCRDLTVEQAEANILGYTIGNDLSCRDHQKPENCGNQYVYAKGFDKFGPIGPVLVSCSAFKNPQKCEMVTKVDGDERQRANIFEEFIWTPAQILSHISQGTTIPAGTAVMTGTPSGIGYFQGKKLEHNSVVEIEISEIGVLRNKIVYV